MLSYHYAKETKAVSGRPMTVAVVDARRLTVVESAQVFGDWERHRPWSVVRIMDSGAMKVIKEATTRKACVQYVDQNYA